MNYYRMNVLNKKASPSGGIYGAEWDGSSTTLWTRTDDAVGLANPNPYYAGMSGTPSSPFDDIMPWSGMVVSEDSEAGTLVSIPKFYYKLSQNSSTMSLKIQISMTQEDGFVCSPAHMDRGDGVGERDVVYVGRYHCGSSNYKSVTGVAPMANVTRPSFRTAIHNLGSTIWMMDFATRFTIWLLYLVEFANWNSQDCIGFGGGGNSGLQAMGYTDSMSYHTGITQSSRITYGFGTQYRYIEGLWDNVYDYIDGCYNNSNGLNIILNPSNFSDSSGGIAVGMPPGGYPSQFTLEGVSGTFPMFIPTISGGSDSTYSCDVWNFSGSYPCLFVGGNFGHNPGCGLFFVGRTSTSNANGNYGSRLMKL